jgi:hypothetical protein
MVTKMPLFRGDSEIDQIFRIFRFDSNNIDISSYNDSIRTLGTPNDSVWAGVTKLPEYQPSFPQHPPQPLSKIVPQLDPVGIDLLQVIMIPTISHDIDIIISIENVKV